MFKFSLTFIIAIILFDRKFFDFLLIYLASQHLFFVSMLNSISDFQNLISKIVVSKISRIFFEYHSSAFRIKIIFFAWKYSRITFIFLSIVRLSLVSTMTSKQQKLKISISNRCQWCQLNYEIWNSHRFKYFSCIARNQQAYEFVLQFFEKHANEIIEKSTIFISFVSSKQRKLNISFENLKMIKKIKINVVKNAKRIKSKVLKIQKVAKSTSNFQNIDIFDSTFTCENRRFSEITNFLQHFQQCQYLYRKSDLLTLLLVCLWDFVFDIWFDKQTIMKSALLNEWIEILRIDFANVSFAKIKTSKMICMRCDSNFNFKNEFRNHVRNQHAKKSINNSNFMINTVKSTCEIVEKSAIICLLDSFVLQKSFVFFATSRKHISKSEIVFETIISSTSSIFSIATVNNALQSMKNELIQCFFVSWIFISTFESKNQKILVRKFATFNQILEIASIFKSVISSKCLSFSFFTLEYISKSTKNASIQRFRDSSKLQIFTATSKQIFKLTLIFETIISSKISHFSFSASKTVSESMKNTSIQCSFISSKSSFFQTFESRFQEISVWKLSEFCSFFSIDTVKSICEIKKKSTIIETFALQIFEIVSSKSSSLQIEIFKIISKSMKTKSNQCFFVSMFSLFQTYDSEHQNICVQKFSEFCSFFTSFTFKLICENKKNSVVIYSSVSFISQKSFIFRSVFKKNYSICRINVFSVQEHYFESSSCHETLRHKMKQQFARRAHQREQKIQKQVELIEQNVQKQTEIEKIIDQFVKNFHLSINAVNFVCKIEKTTKSTKESATCRRCNQIFNFNNKFHEHIREHHARKIVKNLNFRVFTSEFAYKIIEKSTNIRSSISSVSQKSFIFFATSRSQSIWFFIIFESIIASTRSCFFFATFEIASKRKEIATFKCSLISFTFSQKSIRKHQKFHIQKFYLIANDLSRIFAEKSKSFDLRQHHNRRSFQQSFDIR